MIQFFRKFISLLHKNYLNKLIITLFFINTILLIIKLTIKPTTNKFTK